MVLFITLSGSSCESEQNHYGFLNTAPSRTVDRSPAYIEYATSTGEAGIVFAYADPHLYEDEILEAVTKASCTCLLEVPMGETVEVRFICEDCGTSEQHTLTSPSALLLHCSCDRSHPCDASGTGTEDGDNSTEPTEPTEVKDDYREYIALVIKPHVEKVENGS